MKYKILVVDDDQSVIESFRPLLKASSIEVVGVETGEHGLRSAELFKNELALILVDYNLPGISGEEVIRKLLKIDSKFDIIGMSGSDSDELYEKMIGGGALTFISKALSPERKIALISGYLRKFDSTKRILKVNTWSIPPGSNIAQTNFENNLLAPLGVSQNIMDTRLRIKEYANIERPILITGETGTGKEVIARAIHRASKRAKEIFIPINCGAIPQNLIESELFGNERGAFTDAKYAKKGAFRGANRGFIFLDEFGELSPMAQAALLRTIQFHEVRPVGSHETVKVDVQIILATNKNLKSAVEEKSFREDLYYRVNEFQIHLSPLRERLDDIEPLVMAFLAAESKKKSRDFGIRARVIERFKSYCWPGNIRELEAVIEAMTIRSKTDELDEDSLPPRITAESAPIPTPSSGREEFDLAKQRFESDQKSIFVKGLKRLGSIRKLATELGLNKSTLHSKIQELGIQISKNQTEEEKV